MKGKRVQFDDETWAALDMLAKDRMMDFQEVADEAFRDLLKKHNRPTTLTEALRKSAGASAEIVELRPKAAHAKSKSPAKSTRKKASKKASRKAKRSKRR